MQQRLEKLSGALQCASEVVSTFRERGVLLDGEASEGVDASGAWNIVGRTRPFVVGTERVELILEVEIGNLQKGEGADVDAVLLSLSITEESQQAAAECSVDMELFLSSGGASLHTTWDGLELLSLVRNSFTKNGLKFSDFSDPDKTQLSNQDLQSALHAMADIVREARLLVR